MNLFKLNHIRKIIVIKIVIGHENYIWDGEINTRRNETFFFFSFLNFPKPRIPIIHAGKENTQTLKTRTESRNRLLRYRGIVFFVFTMFVSGYH